jgi:hypothetical protein
MGHGWFLCQLRVVPKPEHGQSEMQYFSVSSKLSLTLACFVLAWIKPIMIVRKKWVIRLIWEDNNESVATKIDHTN